MTRDTFITHTYIALRAAGRAHEMARNEAAAIYDEWRPSPAEPVVDTDADDAAVLETVACSNGGIFRGGYRKMADLLSDRMTQRRVRAAMRRLQDSAQILVDARGWRVLAKGARS